MEESESPPVDENTGIISVPGIIAIIGAVVGAIGSLAASAVLVIGALNETTEAVEQAAQTQGRKLNEIHQQTNSNLTELKAQLAEARVELADTKESLALLVGRQNAEDQERRIRESDNNP